jgi:hypothetical protein
MQLDFGNSALFQRQSPRKAQRSRRELTQEEQQEIEYAWKLLDAAGQGEVPLKGLKVRARRQRKWQRRQMRRQQCQHRHCSSSSAAPHAASRCPGSRRAEPRPRLPRRWRCARWASPSRKPTCATCWRAWAPTRTSPSGARGGLEGLFRHAAAQQPTRSG